MTKILAIIVATALASAASAAPSVYGRPSEPIALEAMQNFGLCVASRTPEGARQVLAMDFRTAEYDGALRRLATGHGQCAPGGKLRFNGVLFAGALAEGLLRDMPRGAMAGRLAYEPQRQPIASRSDTETMALCVVYAAPARTADLLATRPASTEEAEVMQSLQQRLGNCLSKDAKVELNRPALRSLLALAAWRIASTPVAAAEAVQ